MAVRSARIIPEIELMVVLVDERPEEVTDFRETIDSVVYASTFDVTERHSQCRRGGHGARVLTSNRARCCHPARQHG